ncbi:MAG TPA: hypothetical protein VN848_12220 [Gemmatimonadales bacterium]|nr:hypothetical protein [Gemmatimonadales bacterium]
MKNALWKAAAEIAFIIFLFYSNLLMGEFTRTGMERGKTLAWALRDVCTGANLLIGAVAAAIGYFVVEFLRRSL